MLADLNFKIFPMYISYNTMVDYTYTDMKNKQTKHVHLPMQI